MQALTCRFRRGRIQRGAARVRALRAEIGDEQGPDPGSSGTVHRWCGSVCASRHLREGGGRHWEPSAARKRLRRRRHLPVSAADSLHISCGTRTPSRWHTKGCVVVIQDRPHNGHANLGITSVYLQCIDSAEIIDTVHSRPAPVISASAGLAVR